ncbi:MAG: C-GCAxxG-C-C family protein, partial [Candidatus Hodarchaeota archaeon]
LTSVVDILGISELNRFYFNNLAVPLGGGFGGFKSMKGWKGPCGAVSGGCAAIGVILGGHERLKLKDHLKTYQRAAIFTHYFEKEFGSVACQELCGTDFNDLSSVNEYLNNKVWEKQCYKYVIFALDQIRKLTAFELKEKWA